MAVAVDRPWALLALLATPVALLPVRKVLGRAAGKSLIAVLGETGRAQLLIGALLALGIAL